jgi:hypothetical protein
MRVILDGGKRAALRNQFETKSIKEYYNVIPMTPAVQRQQSICRQIKAIVQRQFPAKAVRKKNAVRTIKSFFLTKATQVVLSQW